MVRPVTSEDEITLTVRRTFPVSRERVYAAWTDPEQLAQWFGPTDDHSVEVREYDFRVGGRYQIAFSKGGEPARDVVSGEFRQIDPPKRVSYTWMWAEPNDSANIDTLVSVEFLGDSNETEVVITHVRFGNTEMRDRHQQGWTGCLECLGSYFAE